ncbi:MAG: polysulfide reductase NrfD [Planctomycetota bacterium]|nr:polysulfide reductase NrfD [Planctomycetota bacterium]
MQLGFVIDHSRCIGCHACTVACKSENDVQLGSFRTWVKYTETGEFPAVRRHFAVLRCNQCTDAPCVTICPTNALHKRPDGIIDVQRDHCIGCKSCMQGCPYDALYIDDATGTAEKCHFCAHRTERGLAPACAIVCPTEAIIPGDFDDPDSLVSRLRKAGGLTARKTEAGTGPNVLYKEVDPSGVKPLETNAAGGYLWSNRQPGLELAAEEFRAAEFRAMEDRAQTRTTYDIEHRTWWGWRVSAYLVTKSISAGVFLAAVPGLLELGSIESSALWLSSLAILFLLVTTVLLVADLKRPDRFLLILTHPNWSSWLVKGTVCLMAYGALLGIWLAVGFFDAVPDGPVRAALVGATALAAAASAGYTGFLFAQAKGRVLWMQRGLALHLVVQAVLAGAASLLVLRPLVVSHAWNLPRLDAMLLAGALGHLTFLLVGGALAPNGRREEYRQAHALLTRGPFKRAHRETLVLLAVVVVGTALVALAPPDTLAAGNERFLLFLLGVLSLVALWRGEDAFVKAGQALPIS